MNRIESGVITYQWYQSTTCLNSFLHFSPGILPNSFQAVYSVSLPVACIVCVILLETCLTLILGILHIFVKFLLHCTLWRCILECPPPWDKGILVVSRPQSRVLSLSKNVWPVLSLPACRLPFLTIFWGTNFVLQFYLTCLSQSPTFHSLYAFKFS